VSYRVFARKYRPQTFEEVVGQEHITRTLQNAISTRRVAQAYLFVGPRGIGKTSSARILAKALNCVNGPTPNPCGQCDACKEIEEGRSLDVLEIDGASNNGVENIRELRENAAYAPARGPYKIYLIDEVHMLSAGAFNALLKTLEEPPEHVKFIFATTEAQKVPATITSRCQRFDLRRIPAASIASHLQSIAAKEGITMEDTAAEAIARGADGGLRDAESMMDQAVAFCGNTISGEDVMTVFGFTSRETITSLMESILARDAAGSLRIIGQQAEAGKDLLRLLGDVIGHVRDLLVAGVEGGSAAPREKLLMLLDHFAETESRMRWAADKKLQFDVAVIKAVHLLEQASLDDVIETLTALHGGGPLPERPAPAVRKNAEPRERGDAGSSRVAPAPTPAVPPPRVEVKKDIETGKPGGRETPRVPASQPLPVAPVPTQAPPVSESRSVDASVAWERVSATYESSIKYRWLTKGVFVSMSGDAEMLIHLPPSHEAEMKSIIGAAGRSDAETKLAEILGRKVKVILEISEGLVEAPSEEPVPEAPAAAIPEEAPPPPAPEPVVPAVDPMEEFKNDPLIKKALEIFAGEIQATAK
jgi:DNA polymerase-3 subunit gamma/tau